MTKFPCRLVSLFRKHDAEVAIRSRPNRVRALVLENLSRIRRLACGDLMGGLFPSFGTVVSQAVLIGALLGVSKRAGLISTHPQQLKNDAARSAFVSFVNTSEWAVAYVETLLANAVGKK